MYICCLFSCFCCRRLSEVVWKFGEGEGGCRIVSIFFVTHFPSFHLCHFERRGHFTIQVYLLLVAIFWDISQQQQSLLTEWLLHCHYSVTISWQPISQSNLKICLIFRGRLILGAGLVEERGEGELGELFPSFRGEMTRDWMLPANTVQSCWHLIALFPPSEYIYNEYNEDSGAEKTYLDI